MPSSPETMIASAAVSPWTPDELVSSAAAASTASAVSAVAAAPLAAPPAAPLFEVPSRFAIPEALLEPARKSARAAGYAAGWSEGLRSSRVAIETEAQAARLQAADAAADVHERTHRAVTALVRAAQDLELRSAPALADIESNVLNAAFELAEAIIGVAVRDDERCIAAAVARALAAVDGDAAVTVAVHPSDHETLLSSGATFAPRVTLIPDATLSPGDAVARCGASTVDARLSSGIARVRKALGL